MYWNILKKDLKRKKAMNVILLVFVILATMFVSSSVNNILSVTTALDRYLDMASAPDYVGLTMNKATQIDVGEILDSTSSIESYSTEAILFMSPGNVIFESDATAVTGGSNILQGDQDLSINYFLSDDSILKTVQPGEIYLTSGKAEAFSLETGDKVTIEIENVRKEFTLVGTIKDAVFGSEANSICRYIISGEDYKAFTANETVKNLYGGTLYYIHTSDLANTLSEISEADKSFSYKSDRAGIKFTYVFDMIITGLLLVVSVILIAIAFVVLRFTITFTLSEEFREIGVMKAIGIPNLKVRGLYLVKYAAISVIGAAIGLALSFPFGALLMSVSSKSIIIGGTNPVLINILCALLVIGVILLFSFSCTGKVKKMTPIDAIRNGQTGERFRKKSIMSLGKSKLSAAPFLALNDIVSSPKRYGIITLTFFLCLSLLMMLSATVTTMKSGSLYGAFGYAKFHAAISANDDYSKYMVEGGRETLEEDLAEMEQTLAESGIHATCAREISFTLPVTYGDTECSISGYQGTGTEMELYQYTEGSVPRNANEIAITRISASKLNAGIGDTVTIKTIDGEQKCIITAYYQSMYDRGDGIRLHTDAQINYAQAIGGSGVQVFFADDPDAAEIARKLDVIRELYPEYEVQSCEQVIADMIGVTDTLDTMKRLIGVLTILLTALITVLMERSFIAKEQGEIALMKAIGTRNGRIYSYHVLRFAFVGIIAVIIGEIFALPLTHLCIDPIFRMMGMELAVDYIIDPMEMYLIFPAIVLVTTALSAFLTSLYTRKIKSSDTANIE